MSIQSKENRRGGVSGYPNVNIIKEKGQRVSYLKFNTKGEKIETPTSLSSSKEWKSMTSAIESREFKAAFRF